MYTCAISFFMCVMFVSKYTEIKLTGMRTGLGVVLRWWPLVVATRTGAWTGRIAARVAAVAVQ